MRTCAHSAHSAHMRALQKKKKKKKREKKKTKGECREGEAAANAASTETAERSFSPTTTPPTPTASPTLPTAAPLSTPPTNPDAGERKPKQRSVPPLTSLCRDMVGQEAARLSKLMLDLTCLLKPDFKEPRLKTWAKHFDRMVRLDGRTPGQIEKTMRWALGDSFWQVNILGPDKLRKQFDRLELAMRRSRAGKDGSAEDQKVCLIDRAAGEFFQMDRLGKKKRWLCSPCYAAFRESGRADFGTLSPAVLEAVVLKFKAQR